MRGLTSTLALLVALAGCGQAADEGPVVQGLGFVASAAEQAGTARVELRMDLTTSAWT